jgi:UDP-N-acetylmuramate dehydrogenase
VEHPSAQQIFDWVCEIRRAKLPDPTVVGNAGSFFKNPTVSPDQCADIIAREPKIVHYPMPDGSIKLAAGWLIDACGWKGKSIGKAGGKRQRDGRRGDDPGQGHPDQRV